MAAHHHIPEQGPGVLSVIITLFVSIWASIEMEIKHGIITYFFAILSCVTIFFVQRYLKKRFK